MEHSIFLKEACLRLLAEKRRVLLGNPVRLYQPHAKQQMFHAAGAGFRERLFLAGNRCGKTYCGAMEMAIHLTGLYPLWWQGVRFDKPIRAWAASVTAESTRDILQRAYLGDDVSGAGGAIPEGLVLKVSARRGVAGAVDTVYVRHASGGVSALGFKSYDQGREKFQGTSKHFIHLDEEPDISVYEECLLRTLDVGGSVMLTMTPLKGMTDVCERFLTGGVMVGEEAAGASGSGKTVVQASWDDAPHLGEEEKRRLRLSLRPHEVEAREKGVPVLGSGRVFPVSEAEISVPPFEIPPHFKRVFGMDFGWTNPTAVVWAAYDADNDVVYVYDVYSVSERSPADHAVSVLARGKWIPGVCDPAGQSVGQADGVSLMEKYASHGLRLSKAENAVEAGLMQVLERMQTGRLKVFSTLEAWWREFRLYRRDERGQIVKRHDHLMDALRYAVVSGLYVACCERGRVGASSDAFGRRSWVTV